MAAECVIGVDLGGTKLLAGIVDADLNVHHRAYRKSRAADSTELLATVADAVAEVRDAFAGEVSAVGFGIPSLIDRERGVAESTVHLPLADVPFRDLMAEHIGLPIALDNDGNAAMVAEHRHGAAQDASDAVLLTLGTGIAGAIVAGGRLIRGVHGAAGELGHMVIDHDGPRCSGNCPSRGCLEALASGTALATEAMRVAAEHPDSELRSAVEAGRDVTSALTVELAHDGDALARRVVTTIGERLGVGIANVINIFNPSVVVIGGGVIAAGELLLEPARRVARERALPPSRDMAQIVPARFGAESGMLGAALMAFDLGPEGRR
ncbi:MAG TPA: ROK family protein [Baekduia sp.]|nr:ROK family protein [Baekduia sp.]